MGGIVMNENLDLTKILDGCPKGTVFYSSILGDVSFMGIECPDNYPIRMNSMNDAKLAVTSKGTYFKDCGECILFPSKGQRDWSKFERFWDKPKDKFDVNTLHPFDKIIVRDCPNCLWNIDFFAYKKDEDFPIKGINFHWIYAIPYNDETKHLVGTTEDCPEYYKWWEE